MNIEKLKEIGSEWEKGNFHRIYFNSLGKWYGVETERYKTGNICWAALDGEEISNSEARRILGRLADGKVWYCLKENSFFRKGLDEESAKKIINSIKASIN